MIRALFLFATLVTRVRVETTAGDFVIETHPAVGPKLSRAKCKNTALPRPATRGELL